jgi:hypothetical protein
MSTDTKLSDVVEFVYTDATLADIERIHVATSARIKTLRAVRAASVEVGTLGKIVNIKPKALSGLVGTVTAIEGSGGKQYATVLLDGASTNALRYARTKHAARILPGATEYSLGGIPLSCVEPLA